jgi:hypothetical protein
LTLVKYMVLWPAMSVFFLMMPGLVGSAPAQNLIDSVPARQDGLKPVHSPGRATLLSAVLPGAGQAYNHKYWKIPIVYAGLAAAGYSIVSNNRNYLESKSSYLALTDQNDSTQPTINKPVAELRADIDNYRRSRDLSILLLLAWHGLSIIDANVDAHFFTWDVSDDLSLRIRPIPMLPGRLQPGVGFCLTLNKR